MAEKKTVIKVFDDDKKPEAAAAAEPEEFGAGGYEALEVNADNAEEILRTGKGVLKLSRKMVINGEETDSIYFDLSSISAIKYRDIVKKVERSNKALVIDPTRDIDVQMAIFSEASGIPVAELKTGMSMKDVAQMNMVVYYFLAA